jgi:hypothetical protein
MFPAYRCLTAVLHRKSDLREQSNDQHRISHRGCHDLFLTSYEFISTRIQDYHQCAHGRPRRDPALTLLQLTSITARNIMSTLNPSTDTRSRPRSARLSSSMANQHWQSFTLLPEYISEAAVWKFLPSNLNELHI